MLKPSLRTDIAERRRHPRCTLPIPTQVSLNGTSYDATLRNISAGGLYIAVEAAVAARERQPILLAFSSQVGTLEVRAHSVRIRELTERYTTVGTGIAVQFECLGETEQMILSSLLDGAEEQSGSVN